MKTLAASVVIVLVILSTAGAQQTCRPDGQLDMAGVIGSTIGALIGSTVGDGRGQTLATGVGAMIGGVIGESLPPSRRATTPTHSLVKQLHQHRNKVIDAALSGTIPTPRKATPVRPRQQALTHCQEIQLGTFACHCRDGRPLYVFHTRLQLPPLLVFSVLLKTLQN